MTAPRIKLTREEVEALNEAGAFGMDNDVVEAVLETCLALYDECQHGMRLIRELQERAERAEAERPALMEKGAAEMRERAALEAIKQLSELLGPLVAEDIRALPLSPESSRE